MCPMSTERSAGTWSATDERISTLLIESIPRSPSRSIPRLSMSAGYPVFSATTESISATRSASEGAAPRAGGTGDGEGGAATTSASTTWTVGAGAGAGAGAAIGAGA